MGDACKISAGFRVSLNLFKWENLADDRCKDTAHDRRVGLLDYSCLAATQTQVDPSPNVELSSSRGSSCTDIRPGRKDFAVVVVKVDLLMRVRRLRKRGYGDRWEIKWV